MVFSVVVNIDTKKVSEFDLPYQILLNNHRIQRPDGGVLTGRPSITHPASPTHYTNSNNNSNNNNNNNNNNDDDDDDDDDNNDCKTLTYLQTSPLFFQFCCMW